MRQEIKTKYLRRFFLKPCPYVSDLVTQLFKKLLQECGLAEELSIEARLKFPNLKPPEGAPVVHPA